MNNLKIKIRNTLLQKRISEMNEMKNAWKTKKKFWKEIK